MPETGDFPINKGSVVTTNNPRMNLSKPLRAVSRFLYFLFLQCRTHLPPQQCLAFVPPSEAQQSGIGPIFVINLDRQPGRWTDVLRELACILDAAGKPLSERVVRYSACDAQAEAQQLLDSGYIEQFYTLGDQLFVEPQLMQLAGPQSAQNDWSLNQMAFQYAFRMGDFGASAALSNSTARPAFACQS